MKTVDQILHKICDQDVVKEMKAKQRQRDIEQAIKDSKALELEQARKRRAERIRANGRKTFGVNNNG